MKITEIFEKKSEKFFRHLEEKITLKSLNLTKNVIALGGGAFLNEKIRKEFQSHPWFMDQKNGDLLVIVTSSFENKNFSWDEIHIIIKSIHI